MAAPRRLRRSEELSPSSGYKLLVHLASGGMGSVYIGVARDNASSPDLVAIKRAHPHLADDPEFRKMLIAEAGLASRIQHPHVVRVQSVGECEGEVFLVMEYVEGGTLDDLIVLKMQLPPGVAIRIVVDAAMGLHAAHTLADEHGHPLGIVHRDVSPHNVLIGADGKARIADFGVAKALHHDATATQAGVIKGKAAYMAPEYLLQQRLTVQSDVFSLGVVAWEAISGRRLFRGESDVETMHNVLATSAPARLSQHVQVGAGLDDVVARALERNVARRTPTALAFALDLERCADACGMLATREQVAATIRERLGPQIEARHRVLAEAMADPGPRGRDGGDASEPTRKQGTPATLEAAAPSDPQDLPPTKSAAAAGPDLKASSPPVSGATLAGAAGTLSDGRSPRRTNTAAVALITVLALGVAAIGVMLVMRDSPFFDARVPAQERTAQGATVRDASDARATPPQDSPSVAAPTNEPVTSADAAPTASASSLAASPSASAPVRPAAVPLSPGPLPTVGAGGAPLPSAKPWRPKTNPY